MGSASSAVLTAARGRLTIRRVLATTPGRLRLAATLLALSAIVFGIVAADAADTRRRAVRDVSTTERLLVSVVDLSTNLSDAHATAARSFLVGGPEPALARRRYLARMRQAAAGTVTLAGVIEPSSPSAPRVRRITQQLHVYTGLIDEARANYRRGYPVGAAYLRQASRTMRDGSDGMLPSARELYRIQAKALTHGYETGASPGTILAVVLTGGAMLAVLIATQVYLTRATRRMVNPPLALATAVLLGLVCWTLLAFGAQQRKLQSAQLTGSDPVELLTSARILAARADADESIALSARGGGEGATDLKAVDSGFQEIVKPIRGLLRQASDVAERAQPQIVTAYGRYLAAHERVVVQEKIGQFSVAVHRAIGQGADGVASSQAAIALSRVLKREVHAAEQRFGAAAASAEASLGGLSSWIWPLTVLVGVLALLGVGQRLEEYR